MSKEIKHHPDDATMLSFAAGTLAEGLSAVVAAHVSMCPRCQAEVADLELLGATLLLAAGGSNEALAVPATPSTIVKAEPRNNSAAIGFTRSDQSRLWPRTRKHSVEAARPRRVAPSLTTEPWRNR